MNTVLVCDECHRVSSMAFHMELEGKNIEMQREEGEWGIGGTGT